jgi:hypothetical protein
MATDREEQQRRELEEIRRSFTETGRRMGSMFEPAQQHDGKASNGHGTSTRPAPAAAATEAEPASAATRQRPTWAAAAAVALVCLLAGTGLGALLPRSSPKAGPPATSIVIREVPGQTQAPSRAPSQPAPAESCRRTAQLADDTIAMLLRNDRSARFDQTFNAFAAARDACRQQPSP